VDHLEAATGTGMTEVERLREQLRQVERDLVEIADQEEAGELDAATYDRLRTRYEDERRELLDQLSTPAEPEPPSVPTERLLSGRRLAGAAVLVIAAVGLTIGVVNTTGDSTGVEGIASDVVAGGGVDLDEISNEQMETVIAENPDIAPMRLALADRYFADGDYSSALTHYMYVLDTMGVDDPGALANVGWMTYQSGVADTAAAFVERSLEIQPDGGVAYWYLANIRFYGLSDPAGAVEPLRSLLRYDNLPAELRTAAEELLRDAEESQ
jgi:tetratricopeptide (TPR) repeat protein